MQKFIEDNIFHQVGLLQLPVIQAGIPQPNINRIVFLDILVILVPFDVVPLGFVELTISRLR